MGYIGILSYKLGAPGIWESRNEDCFVFWGGALCIEATT